MLTDTYLVLKLLFFFLLHYPLLSLFHYAFLVPEPMKFLKLGTKLAERVLREGHLLWAAFFHP